MAAHSSTLRGRNSEMAVLDGSVDAAERGRGGVILLEGPAGIGKSRLVSHAVKVATEHGVPVAAAAANELERLVPLAPLINALGEMVETEQAGVAANPWLLEQLRSRLEERASVHPLVVALDDVQWADSTTVSAVQSLVSQLGSYALLWVLAGRGAAGDQLDLMFGQLEHRLGAVRIQLDSLSCEAVAEIIGDVTGALPDRELMIMAEDAGGNPLLVIEMVEGLRKVGAIEVAKGRARLVAARLPRQLQPITAYRLDRLSVEAKQVLEVAAVLGQSFSVDDLAGMLGEPVGRLLPPLREALTAGVLVPTNSTLAFRHQLIHRAVYEGVPAAVRGALHRDFGALLLERGGPTVPAAAHLVKGARHGDREALAGLDGAAREVQSTSPQSAADLALRAFELTEPSDDGRFSRAVSAVDALVAAGRLGKATELACSTLTDRGAPAVPRAELRLTLSSIRLMSGRPGEALAEDEAVLAEPGLPDRLQDAAELGRLRGLLAQGDLSRARQRAEAILAGGERSGGDAVLSAALATLSLIAWDEGRLADALGLFRAAVHRGDRMPVEARRTYPRLGLALMLATVGECDEAGSLIDAAHERIERAGDTMWAAAPAIFRARLHLAACRLDDAVAEAQAGLAIAEELGTRLYAPLALSVLAAVALLRGDLGEAAQQFERCRAEPLFPWGGVGSASAVWLEGRLAEAKEGPTGAAEVLAGAYDDLSVHRRLLIEEPAAAAWLVRAALAVGDHVRAEVTAACAEQLAAENHGFPTLGASAAHARGLLDRDPAALEQAAAGLPHPWARGSAQEDAGAILADRDHQTERAQLERALAAYEQSGADRDAARVRDRLRRMGARLRHGSRAKRPRSGWASLTNTEHSVSELVADGLTNRQVADRMYLSRHTVDFHLRQIFRKLGISSRVQLTRLTVEHATDGQ